MKLVSLALVVLALSSFAVLAQQQAPVSQGKPSPGLGGRNTQQLPPTKKTGDGVCHSPGAANYGQIKDFFPFVTLEDCVKSGGKPAKR